MNTAPVNHSSGPGLVAMEFLVTCIDPSLGMMGRITPVARHPAVRSPGGAAHAAGASIGSPEPRQEAMRIHPQWRNGVRAGRPPPLVDTPVPRWYTHLRESHRAIEA